MQRQSGEARRHGVVQRGGSGMCGGHKSGRIPLEQVIPAPGQTTQPTVPVPGR